MSKIMSVARREFVATVTTKGFIVGVLITPAIIGVMIVVMPILMSNKPPKIDGEIAIQDPTGRIAEGLRDYLRPEAIAERWGEAADQVMEKLPDEARAVAAAAGTEESQREAMAQFLGEVPVIQVTEIPGGVDVEREKELLHEGSATSGGRLAVVVLHGDAVVRSPGSEAWGTYDLFVREKLDDRVEDEIKRGLYGSIISARAAAAGLDADEVRALTRVGRIRSKTVTEKGETETNEALNMMLPAGFMVLLLMAVFTGGQNLMTTVIEEKSSRVVEVLLSAVSPIELMTGKILGQMTVSFVILAFYAGMGIAAAISFAFMGLIDPWLFLYLVIFFLIAYSVLGSLMAAIGAAVNELREAQSLLMPVVMTMMVPWLLWLPITRDPNSLFATVLSFVPPLNSFVILLRMTSTTPPPLWQVWLSILIGAASVYGAIWFAAKVFRVGLLMHGKPPDLRTLIRWVRLA